MDFKSGAQDPEELVVCRATRGDPVNYMTTWETVAASCEEAGIRHKEEGAEKTTVKSPDQGLAGREGGGRGK